MQPWGGPAAGIIRLISDKETELSTFIGITAIIGDKLFSSTDSFADAIFVYFATVLYRLRQTIKMLNPATKPAGINFPEL